MLSGWEAFFAKYGAIAVGLLFGTSAKYALALGEGRKVTTRMVVIDALLIGMIALLASEAVARLGASGHTAATVAALFAVSSDRLIRLLRTRFLQRVDAELRSQTDAIKGEVAQQIQVERSGAAIIDDTISGKAPADYAALRPRPQPDQEDPQ